MKKLGDAKYAEVFEDDEGIIHIILKEKDYLNLQEVKEYINHCFEIAKNDDPKPVLFDSRKVENLTPGAAKQLISEDAKKLTKAAAVLIKPISPIAGVGISILLKLQNYPFPIKFFKRENEALAWLEQFKN